ncbi:MAG: hypothetical protein DLM72_18780 [Candidatus Nitrosopolaris wilkensis]|nr:MAG: hypothetical protein DLM72_18780 [Candidatus Nitrosopolaris wilkensis]
MKNIFSKTTGNLDGTSILKIGEYGKWNKSNIMTKRLLFDTLMSPTSIATVHQLLLSQFNWLHWERVEQNASIDAIVFDEIHSYDFYTSKLFVEPCH